MNSRTFIVVFSAALIAGLGLPMRGFAAQTASTPQKKKSASNSTKSTHKAVHSSKSAHSAPRHAPAKTATASRRRSTKTPVRKTVKRRTTRRVTRRITQQQPTPERYKEIQQALADKGFFNGTVDGAWNADSVDALKRFEREQNIPDDGKIGSLALIALGLGPRRSEQPQAAAADSSSPLQSPQQ